MSEMCAELAYGSAQPFDDAVLSDVQALDGLVPSTVLRLEQLDHERRRIEGIIQVRLPTRAGAHASECGAYR